MRYHWNLKCKKRHPSSFSSGKVKQLCEGRSSLWVSGFMRIPGSLVTFASKEQEREAANTKAFSEQISGLRDSRGGSRAASA